MYILPYASLNARSVTLSKPADHRFVLYGGHNSYPLIPLADGR